MPIANTSATGDATVRPPAVVGSNRPLAVSEPPAQQLPMSDVQGLIFRGYTHPFVRHFFLKINDPAKTKKWIGSLVNQPGTLLQINSAEEWPEKPRVLLNLGMTYEGLQALGIPGLNMQQCFGSFVAGAPTNANLIGDTGESDPSNWVGGLGNGTHLALSMWTLDEPAIAEFSKTLRDDFAGFLTEQYFQDGQALPDNYIHFGYKDSISQPHISGLSGDIPDAQDPVEPYNFIVTNAPLAPYTVPDPNPFWINGCFGAFRILKQDVEGFSNFLVAQRSKIDPDRLAAQFCGRWNDGTPLELSPNHSGGVPDNELNNFNYVTPYADPKGTRCPYSSHLRRTNARKGTVSGNPAYHRIMRRAMPYGPAYKGPDGIERGLVGYFMGVDLGQQFEFIMQNWVNGLNFTPTGEPTGYDPLLGANGPAATSVFDARLPNGETVRISNIPRFVTTRGGAYCFLPSISGLKYLANT